MMPAMPKTRTGTFAARPLLSAARLGGALCALLAAGCATTVCEPQRKEAAVARSPVAAVSIEPTRTPSAPAPAPAPAARPAAAPAPTPAATPTPRVTAKAPPAPASAPAPAAMAAKADAPTAAVAKPAAAPPLDLKSLETRLRETKAIGVFTKLSVKNQVDDLLERFREFYKGRLKTSLAELRRAYDLLVLKVLALLQDADAPLASALAASRESIWGLLSDREKFSGI